MKTPFRTAGAGSSLPGCPVAPPRSVWEGNNHPRPARGGFSEAESQEQVERGPLVGTDHHRVDRGRELQTGSRGEDGEPQPSPGAVVPRGRRLAGEEHAPDVGDTGDSVPERQQGQEPPDTDPQLGVSPDGGVPRVPVLVESQQGNAAHAGEGQRDRHRGAAEKRRVEERIRPPVLLRGSVKVQEHVCDQVPAERCGRGGVDLGERVRVAEDGRRMSSGDAEAKTSARGELTGPGVEQETHLATPLGQSGRDRKSTRLNSSHLVISYAVFCLKKKIKLNHLHSYIQKKQTIMTSKNSI